MNGSIMVHFVEKQQPELHFGFAPLRNDLPRGRRGRMVMDGNVSVEADAIERDERNSELWL